MSRLVLDSINYSALAATRWPHLIGYANGRISRWTDAQIAQTRQRGQLLGLVDVLGTAPRLASILDFERGDVQSPAVVHEWVRARNQFADDGTVYCSPRSISTVVGGLRGEKCNLFVVDLTEDGEPPFTVPHYPGLPANVRVIARQFVFGPRSGGNYDMSIFYADDFHPEQQHPAHLFAARAAAAADLGPYENASSGAELTDPRTGQIAPYGKVPEQLTFAEQTSAAELTPVSDHPFQVMTLPEPFGANLPCDWCPGPAACAAAGKCLEPDGGEATAAAAAVVDQAAAELAGAALVLSTAPSSPAINPAAEHQAAEQAATARQLGAAAWPSTAAAAYTAALEADQAAAASSSSTPGPGTDPADVDQAAADQSVARGLAEFIADAKFMSSGSGDGGAAAAGSASAAAAAAQPTLNHEFIRKVLVDVGEVARQFRAGGWHHVATELERAGSLAWELGSAFKAAGL